MQVHHRIFLRVASEYLTNLVNIYTMRMGGKDQDGEVGEVKSGHGDVYCVGGLVCGE